MVKFTVDFLNLVVVHCYNILLIIILLNLHSIGAGLLEAGLSLIFRPAEKYFFAMLIDISCIFYLPSCHLVPRYLHFRAYQNEITKSTDRQVQR